MLHTALEFVLFFFRQVFHDPFLQLLLGFCCRFFLPALVGLFLRLVEQLLAARLRNIAVTIVKRHLVNLFFGGDHAIHDAAHLQAWLRTVADDSPIDVDQEGTELAEYRLEAFGRCMTIMQIHLKGTSEALLFPDALELLNFFDVLMFLGIDNLLLPLSELFLPRCIFILLGITLLPGCPVLHDLQLFCRDIIDDRQVLEIHQKHVAHLM